MGNFYDDLETRDSAARAAAIAEALPRQLAAASVLEGYGGRFDGIDMSAITSAAELTRLPVLRKSDLVSAQSERPPLGGYADAAIRFTHVFQSPGPIYEPGRMDVADWWRFGRFMHAAGIGASDVVQNCFGYHLTPAGIMMESGARAVGATVIPAGTGQTELQVQAAKALGATAYAGTPDYLKVILEKADAMGVDLAITKAAVSGGALFPSLREWYEARGIKVTQCYATADLGHVATEITPGEGMVIDEGVIVEIVTPGTGDPVAPGEVGEVLVTSLNPDYPLIRFATGDMSALHDAPASDGRTNMRIKGWMGRADQTAKIKGMFVRPEQVAALVAATGADRVRVIATREGEADKMIVKVEGEGLEPAALDAAVKEHLKLRGDVEQVGAGSLPRDGVVIEDQRSYD
ncbi:MAG: AMP-dependent synthetase [Rhodobacterales bacterium]|nr:MAG: AMP-dependent synthetase [Rhodobacterales bacterium]